MFEKAVETTEKYNLINNGEKIIIGLSGGADSVCLLYFLYTLAKSRDLKLLAIHINHGLRGSEADDDEMFSKELCLKLNIEFLAYHINLCEEAKKRNMTEEESGRSVRYEIFYNAVKNFKADKIAVAHTMNDNAETMLMNLCRGTGISGLCGISPLRDNIIRPLIEMSRSEVEQCLNELKIPFKTDSTNKSLKYTRNRIRLKLIPWIKENINPSVIKALSKSSSIIKEENSYLDELAQKSYEQCIIKDDCIRLSCKKLKELDKVILRRVLRTACRSYNKELHNISFEHIEKIIELLDKQTGKKLNLPNNICIQKASDSILILKEKINNGYCYLIKEEQPIFIKEIRQYVTLSKKKKISFENYLNICTVSLNYDKINGDLFIRTRQTGDKIYLKGINGYKRLKTLFIDLKIPQTKRSLIPLLANEKEIISVIGIKNSALYLSCENCNAIYMQLWEENKIERNNNCSYF